MTLNRIIALCEKRGFFKITNNPPTLTLGPVGCLLRANLKNEWFINMVIHKDLSVFLSENAFVDTYAYAKATCAEKLPFGVAEIVRQRSTMVSCGENNCTVSDGEELQSTVFTSPNDSLHYFHQMQRQRRMWWRKFSASPSLYSLSDIKHENGKQMVDIQANYPWGAQIIETISLHTSPHPLLDETLLSTKDGRKRVLAHYVTSQISLPQIVLNALWDAYEELPFHGEARPLFRFHRKLAPYKASFAISSQSEDLNQLALYLCKQLRSEQISCFFTPSSFKTTLENQWKQYDQLGIPYNVLLNENTLKNGIIQLRNRDTTLKEQVHVTDLSNYVQKIFKNY